MFSFNIWPNTLIGDLNFFGLVDYLSQNIMLPLGGLLIAVFAVWKLPKQIMQQELGLKDGPAMWLWYLVGGIIAPLGVAAVFIYTLMPLFTSLLATIQGG